MRALLALAIAVLALALPVSGSAAPPSNDGFDLATVVASVPFSDSANLDEATTEAGEPQACTFKTRSVWYRYAPAASTAVTVDMSGSSPGVSVALWRSFGGIGNLSFEGCLFGGSTVLGAQAGGTYYIQAGDSSIGPAQLQLAVAPVPPPPNDAFVDAKAVGSLPYSDVVQMLASTLEPDEPAPAESSFLGSAWWRFVAPNSGPMLVSEAGCCATRRTSVYTGAGLVELEEVPVARSFGRLIFQAEAGTEYMIQLGHSGGLCCGADLGITVEVAPNPGVAIFSSPFDPSSYDTVQFFGSGFDPAGFSIESWSWDFGDGATGSEQSMSHRYIADGDYQVTLTIVTQDGRTASTSRMVTVITHDVGVTKFVVPQSAQVGKTRSITVEVASSRYDEDVQVLLYRSVPGGFEHIATSTQLVSSRKRGTQFSFSYTFRPEDAEVGKVTFKAVAVVVAGRDALPADNEAVSLPTKVM